MTGDKSEAARYGIEAGIDIELPAADIYAKPLLSAIEAGRVSIELIGEAVVRVLTMKYELSLFDNPYVPTEGIAEIYSNRASLELSRTIAEKSVVLLKNEGNLLPLNPGIKTIAVIGQVPIVRVSCRGLSLSFASGWYRGFIRQY